MTLFERVKKVSKQKGYSSLKTLAEDANLGVNAVYQWKTQVPRMDNLQAVADVLGVSVDYLLGNTDDMHSDHTDHEPVDLYTVTDDERDQMISANGQPISDDDWAIIKAVLAKYPKRD